MKNLSLALNGVLTVAVIVLYVLHFSSQKGNEVQPEATNVQDSVAAEEQISPPEIVSIDSMTSNLPVAYVNIDELNAGYKYIKDVTKKAQRTVESKKKQLDAEKKEVMGEYQMFMENYQAGVYKSQQELEERQRYFQEKQQELMKKEYDLEYSLERDMAKTNQKIMKNVSDYLSKYSKELNYSFILATGTASSVLYASDSLDITAPILEGLNAEYSSKK